MVVSQKLNEIVKRLQSFVINYVPHMHLYPSWWHPLFKTSFFRNRMSYNWSKLKFEKNFHFLTVVALLGDDGPSLQNKKVFILVCLKKSDIAKFGYTLLCSLCCHTMMSTTLTHAKVSPIATINFGNEIDYSPARVGSTAIPWVANV